MEFIYPIGATPLDPDEIQGLKPHHLTTQTQLNEWEYNNILQAEKWLLSRSRRNNILTIDFLITLHKKMFSDTWAWAGKFRSTLKNIGVDPVCIQIELKNLLDDVNYQITYKTLPYDEIAYKFHHRLVSIHPFPNGNGRHARMLTDELLEELNQTKFSWGRFQFKNEKEKRSLYINVLREADKLNYAELAAFVRS